MEPDLLDLLSAWSGAEIDPARGEALLGRLRDDSEFRRGFVAEIRTLGQLDVVQAPEPRWLRLEDELGWTRPDFSIRDALEDRIIGRLGEPARPDRPARLRMRWPLAAAAVLLTTLASVAVLRSRPPAPGAGAPTVAEARQYPRVDTADGLAMVVRLDGVTWEPTDQPLPAEGDVLAAGRLKIRSGRMMLSMLTGVVVDVQGPADLELLDSGRIYCHRGRLRTRVPPGAEGFLVLGPSSAVVDLGTEFGLNVDADGRTSGEVFQGKLEAALLGESGTSQRSYFLDAASPASQKGFAIDARTGSIGPVAASDDFIPASRPISPPLDLDAGYAEAVRRSKPWAYWRFDAIEGGSVPDEVPGRPSLRVNGPIRLGAAPGGNRWAEFRPTDAAQFFEMGEPWHPTWRSGFAFEFWFLSESIGHETLVAVVSPRNSNHHTFLLELTARNRLTMHKPASVRLLHRCPPGFRAGDSDYSHDPYIPYRWHHVVGQINRDRIELYKDGALSASLSIRPEHVDVPCHLFLGRLTPLPGSGGSIDRPLIGRMDEVALYDRPLTPDEIRDHHRRGTSTPTAAPR